LAITPCKERIAVAAIAVALAVALSWQAWRVGVTVDEPAHLVSSYLYWGGADMLQPGDMPPLVKIAGGLVPRLLGLPLPPDLGRPGETRHEWNVALGMMAELEGERAQRLFFWSRLPLLVFPLATALRLWWWGRQIFSPAIGLLLMLAFALEPTAMAHGPLFKNDLAATFGYLLFWYRAWKYWKNPGLAEAGWLGVALLIALLSKFTTLFLIGLVPVVILLRWLARKETGARRAAAAMALALAIAYLGTLAAYQFRTRRMSAYELTSWKEMQVLPAWFLAPSHVFRVVPVPQRMWDGCASLLAGNARAVPVYMLGGVHPRGHPLYFAVALAVKIPAPLQILLLGGAAIAALGFRRRRLRAEDVFWLAPGLLYIALASLSAFQLGVRLVLPALPFGLLMCGLAMQSFWRGGRRAVPLFLMAWLMAGAVSIYPHGISFMNIWSGGPDAGLRYLADSNLDWGHALPDLARFVRERRIKGLRLSYFGSDNPYRFFRPGEIELVAPPWSDELAGRQPRLVPAPGYWAVSASLLPGQLFQPQYRDYYGVFAKMRPVARVANAIYVFKME
jgi:hypothetical protein